MVLASRAMRTRTTWAICLLAATASLSAAADKPVKLIVKPLLCLVDKGATTCNVTFDIRWKSVLPAEYCLNDEALTAPLRCWPSTVSGEHQQ